MSRDDDRSKKSFSELDKMRQNKRHGNRSRRNPRAVPADIYKFFRRKDRQDDPDSVKRNKHCRQIKADHQLGNSKRNSNGNTSGNAVHQHRLLEGAVGPARLGHDELGGVQQRWRAIGAGDPPRKCVTRAVRYATRPDRMRYLALYDMNRATDAKRSAFLTRVGTEMEAL